MKEKEKTSRSVIRKHVLNFTNKGGFGYHLISDVQRCEELWGWDLVESVELDSE